jgi:hypothetical protein
MRQTEKRRGVSHQINPDETRIGTNSRHGPGNSLLYLSFIRVYPWLRTASPRVASR